MTKIEQFNRASLKMLRPEIEAVLAMVTDQYGIRLEIGGIGFTDNRFTCRLTGTIPQFDLKKEFEKDMGSFAAPMMGLPADAVGTRFTFRGRIYLITEINLRRPKFPVSCERADGKKFKFPVRVVKQMLETK